ncbi:MAG: GNAT family N-acetyltransferase [Paracoccaceae bacterium]
MTNFLLRPARAADRPALRRILRETGLFSRDERDFLDGLIADHVDGRDPDRRWFVALCGRHVTAGACLAPEALAPDVLNLLFLGVERRARRQGTGGRVVTGIEGEARALGARLVLIETSSLPGLAPARALYARLGYAVDGTIRGYYGAGDDKLIFRKTL